jgi:hypothetical protein
MIIHRPIAPTKLHTKTNVRATLALATPASRPQHTLARHSVHAASIKRELWTVTNHFRMSWDCRLYNEHNPHVLDPCTLFSISNANVSWVFSKFLLYGVLDSSLTSWGAQKVWEPLFYAIIIRTWCSWQTVVKETSKSQSLYVLSLVWRSKVKKGR